MKVYYTGVLFKNWKLAIKSNKKQNKNKAWIFMNKIMKNKVMSALKDNMKTYSQKKTKFFEVFSKYFFKLKRVSFKTMKLETKYSKKYYY